MQRFRVDRSGSNHPVTPSFPVCFVVAPAWRQRGVARRLLDYACDLRRRQGLTVVQAYPAREADSPGGMHFGPLKLYLDAGFTVWRDVPDDPSVTVRKSL